MSDDVYQDTSGNLNSQFINRAAFAVPALGTYGDAGFFSFYGFADWGLDAALSRVFPLPGGHRIEGRLEAFNLTNAAIPMDPSTNLAAATFGRVTAVRDPRILQFAVKYVF